MNPINNASQIVLKSLTVKTRWWVGVLSAAVAAAQPMAQAQNLYELHGGGQLNTSLQDAPTNYKAGHSFYSAAWPLMGDYPTANDNIQSGLYGTWLGPLRSAPNAQYTTIEGGLGWWRDHNFQTATPKFSMGGVAIGNEYWCWANSPGNGSDAGNGKYGVAQLSSTLLFPPDGLNLRQGTNGELFGFGCLPLPLTEPKATTAGQALPTGNHCWTLFLNAGNFKGPAAFFTPYFWSQISVQHPEWSGETFDACWGQSNKTFAMETQGIMRSACFDLGPDTYVRSMPIYYPVDTTGYSQLLHKLSVYDQDALWNDVEQWLNTSGPAPSGLIKPSSTFVTDASTVDPVWHMDRGNTRVGNIDWSGVVSPYAPNSLECGYKWRTDKLPVSSTANGLVVRLPEYYKGSSSPNATTPWVPIDKADMPAAAVSALAGVTFTHPILHDSLVPYDSNDPVWSSPGPSSGPSVALLGDGSYVTYYWYRFADQPALQKADMTLAERNRIQGVCEKIHREWKNDRDYLAPPTTGTLAELDPGVIVAPPLGLEYGYVPIAWRQDWGGSVASPGGLNFTSIPTNPAPGAAFSVTVRALNSSGVAQNVTADTQVKLSVASGYGTLGGNTTATIPSGSSSVTITGITYSAADSMTLTAAATCLSPTTSAALAFVNLSGNVNLYSRPATAVSAAAATLNATLDCRGTNANIQVYWGLYNGGNNATAWENTASVGSWTNSISTNVSRVSTGLLPDTVYYYIFRGTNGSGSTWAPKVLTFKTLKLAPEITSQPVSKNSVVGSTAKFTVVALRGMSYQWLKGSVPLTDGGQVSGANSATLSLTNLIASNAGAYSVVISNNGGQATSNSVTLTVVPSVSLTWDANGTGASVTDGAGQWASNNWWNGTANVAWGDNNDAKIGSGGTGGVISLDEVMVRNLTFNEFSGNYTLVNGILTVGGSLTYASSGFAELTSVIKGPGSLTKNGSGTLTVAGAAIFGQNSYSGGTVINDGTFVWGTIINGSSPDCSSACGTGPVTLNSGGTIIFQRAYPSNALILNGGKLEASNGWGAALSGPVTTNSTTIVEVNSNVAFLGNVSGAGGFTKTGNGPFTLSGSNTYRGDTMVQAGKIAWPSVASVSPGHLLILNGAAVDLAYSGTAVIKNLTLGGTAMASGTYGSTTSPATNKNDTYFSGTGTVTVPAPVPLEVNGLPITSGLVLRMDASKILGSADGAQLNTWADTSGMANDAIRQSGSSSGYPKLVANGVNGKPVVRFNSPTSNTGDYFKFNRISNIRSVFWVLKENAGVADYHSLLGDSVTYDFHRGSNANGSIWGPYHTSLNIRNGVTKLMGNPINGVTTVLPSESFQLVSLVTTGNVSADQICQDRIYHGSWQGDIAEILIYDRALTTEEENQVGTYLGLKYGLPTVYDALPVADGLVLRMDASKISGTADGAQLNTWVDTSGTSNNAIRQSGSSSGYPKLVANAVNGKPVVRFNSPTSSTGDYFKFNRISTIRSVFWVLKENAGLGDYHSLLGDSSTYDFHRGLSANGPLWNAYHTSANIKDGVTKLMGSAINGTTTALPSGNFQLVSLVTTGNVSADQICQDRIYHGSWQGDIAEILIYNRALTPAEELLVGTYLTTKYSLVTGYPASLTPVGIAYAAWAAGSAQQLPAASNGPMSDPDGDGICNMLEFALGGLPMSPSQAILPLLTKTNGEWSLNFSRSDLSQGTTTQTVEFSDDLKVWTQIVIPAVSGNGVVVIPGIPFDSIRVTIPGTPGKPSFARLKIND
jgi:autotransporter-associated beta strand protein